uniref:MIF4G domain-containing protein n=1 Tax=Angiostrongylus cantonensis TaxID=6313 RepID=A0A0K0DJJ1_ANGCA
MNSFRERSKGKPYNQDALNAVSNHHAGAASVSLGAPQPSFATPTIQNVPAAPQQEYDMTSPTMRLPVGTTIHPMGYGMSFLQHGGHYVARPGNGQINVNHTPLLTLSIYTAMFILPFLAPPTHMRAQPPQQYYQPQQMFVQQQQFFSGPQYSRQPGMDYDPHTTAMSTVYMSQEISHPTPIQIQPPPHPVQQHRNKNILTIRDPNTFEVVDLCARTESASENRKDEAKDSPIEMAASCSTAQEVPNVSTEATDLVSSSPDPTDQSTYKDTSSIPPAFAEEDETTHICGASDTPIDGQEQKPTSDITTAETVSPSTNDQGSILDVEAEESSVDAVDTPDIPTPDTEEEERRKAKEEEERKRQREVELEALLHSLLSNPTEVDKENLIYGRAFLYCVRDLEKECKRCPCPLSQDKIVKLGIDLNSMPKGGDNKKQHSFIPPWANQSRQSNKPSNRPYGGRFSHNDHRGGKGGGNKKFPPSARPSIERNIERAVSLHKAENAWKAEKIRPEDLEKEEARTKASNLAVFLLKKVRALMNKITPTTKDELIKEFLNYNVSSSPEQLAAVINIIFDKAVEEPKFCPIYAEVCKQQVDKELKENSKLSLCRNALLNRAQETFVNKTWEEERNIKVKAIDEEEDPKKKLQLQIELQEADDKFRRRKFGNITFIGQLYRQTLLSTKIVQWCLYDLINHSHRNPETKKLPEPPFDEESLQCAIQLIENLGKQLDSFTQDFNGKEYLDQTLQHLECVSNMCSNKIRFMVMNVIELRQNRWLPRKGVDQGPKKLADIHNDIKLLMRFFRNFQYDRKLRTGGTASQHGRNPPVSRNSLDNRFGGGNKGGDRRSIAASKAKQTPSSVQPKNVSLLLKGDNSLGGSNRKTWHQGSGGGGNSTAESKSGWQKGRDEIQRKEPDSEEMKALQEQLYREIGKEIVNLLENYDCCNMKLDECVAEIFKMVNAEEYGRPNVNEIFSRFTEFAVEKVRKPLLPKLGHILCLALQSAETKSEALAGMARYCTFAVEAEMWMDIPDIWSRLAELLVNAVYCDPTLISGVRPSFKDFTDVFLEAGKDDRKEKKYELLVISLKRMAEMNAKVDPQDHATMSSFVYSAELPFLPNIDQMKLDSALRACRPDVPGFEDLYAVLHHH